MSEIPNDVLIELSQITDMGKNVASSVSDESDLSEIGSDELNVTTPPQRGALKKQSKKLRAKYRIMRHALIDEQIANIDKHIEQVRAGTHPRIRDAIFKVESKHKRRLEMLEERKKLYFGRINAIYNASCQAAVQDYRVRYLYHS